MSEINEPIFMEEDEYLEYLKQKSPNNKEGGKSTPVAQISLYQINKDLVRGLKKMNNMEINKALEKVLDWYDKYNTNMYFALLNHEQHYFTIFHEHYNIDAQNTRENFIAALKDILMNYYGDNDIRAIDVIQGDSAVEIWGMWNGEPSVGYLFPYDQGVVYY